ncbi:MAG: M23 family metallopeptidase [Vulcanimicrobiaceae bacterium]
MKQAFLVKVIPPKGYSIYRVEFGWRHLAAAAVALVVLAAGSIVYIAGQLRDASVQAQHYESLTHDQQRHLAAIDAEADRLGGELRRLKRQNETIRRLVGAPDPPARPSSRVRTSRSVSESLGFSAVDARLDRIAADSAQVTQEGAALRSAALHVLNMHHLAELSRARFLAEIPSINPIATGDEINAGFGWRTNPWPEFHEGVDLAGDYGSPVHAAAAGSVVFAGYDGGYGKRIEIDHGNGYHTWYCHLSKIDVQARDHVTKAEAIGLVGSTGASTGPHLHYQVMYEGKPVDPEPFLSGVPPKVLAELK